MVYQLTLPKQWKQKRIHDMFHTSLLTPYHETEAHRVNYPEPPPDIIEGEEEYKVERILDSKRIGRNKKLHYLIQWKGYSEAHDTWELESNVEHAQESIRQFHQQHPAVVQTCYSNSQDKNGEDPSPSLMSSNASQNSSKSDLSLPINWTPYPATLDDNSPTATSPTQGNQHDSTSLATTVLGLTLANPGAVQVINAAPIWVRATSTTLTQPSATLHTSLQRAPHHHHPAWAFLDPEVYDSDGERRRIDHSPTSTSPPTDSHPPSPPLPRGFSQSPPSASSVVASTYQTAPSGPVSPPSLSSPPHSNHGLEGQDERAHYLGEGAQ